jgi:hypothetical protein
VVDDHQFGPFDAVGERCGEAGRGNEVPASVSRRRYVRVGRGVMSEDGFGLVDEGVHRPRSAAAGEGLQAGDELRLLRVHVRSETPREDAWITVSATLPRARAMTCQLLTTAATRGSVFAHALCSDNEADRGDPNDRRSGKAPARRGGVATRRWDASPSDTQTRRR